MGLPGLLRNLTLVLLHLGMKQNLCGSHIITNSDLNRPCFAWHPYGKSGLFKTELVIVQLLAHSAENSANFAQFLTFYTLPGTTTGKTIPFLAHICNDVQVQPISSPSQVQVRMALHQVKSSPSPLS